MPLLFEACLVAIKTFVKRIISRRAVGGPLAILCRTVGFRKMSTRISRLCGYVPEVVTVCKRIGQQRLQVAMHSADGRDQVARQLWLSPYTEYEDGSDTLFAAIAATGDTVIDVGANTGYYALVAASCTEVRQVYAFEPFPEVAELLRANVRLNRKSDRVLISTFAVGSQTGQSCLYVPNCRFRAVETSCSLNPAFRPEHVQQLSVNVVALDDYLGGREVGRIGAIKIDVESTEVEVLRGAQRILREHRPFVLCEVLPAGDAAGIDALLRELTYRPMLLLDRKLYVRREVRPSASSPNQLFVPSERMAELGCIVAETGFKVVADE